MPKVYLAIFALVLSSQIISIVRCDDGDEFAEFDADFGPAVIEQAPPLAKQDNIPNKKLPSDRRESPIKDTEPNVEESTEPTEPAGQKKPDLKLVNAPSLRQHKLESYYVEILFLFTALLYLVNFFLGSAKNKKFAQDCYEQSKDLLKQQFAVVGGAPTISDAPQKRDADTEALLASLKKQRGLIKASESLFTIWSSGRVGLEGLLIEINLLKRQDLFSMALTLLKASKDSLTLRFALAQDGYENFVFCIAHRTQAAKLVRDMVDLSTFCPKRKVISQYGIDSEKLLVLSELSDVTSFILDQRTAKFLKKYERSINYIHITDHYSNDRSEDISPMQKLAHIKRIATFSFSFPTSAEDRSEFITFSLSLLDRLRRFKLARDSKIKSEKNRQKITEYIQKAAFAIRQEAIQAKKEELRRQEKERIYNEEDPEKQRRWEQKEAKRELKKTFIWTKMMSVEEKKARITSNYETIEVLRDRLEEHQKRERSGMSRSDYIKMILDATKKVNKQNGQLAKAVLETRELQREIKSLNGRIDRIYNQIEDTTLRDAKRDLWSQERYKLLTILHKSCAKLIQTVQETGDLTRELRQTEDRISQLRVRQAVDTM